MNAANIVDYAAICNTMLPRIFADLPQSIVDSQKVDDFHSDIDHMPPDLQSKLAGDINLWGQYCAVFLKIITLLESGESPTRRSINASLSAEFMREVGGSQYALDYLLRIIEQIGYRSYHVMGYEALPACWNDFSYTMMRQRLLME